MATAAAAEAVEAEEEVEVEAEDVAGVEVAEAAVEGDEEIPWI